MRVGIIQSNYIPWRGYFDFIDDVDVFIIYDDVQYTKSDWRNRNKLKTSAGMSWITVPVRRDGLDTLITEARIDWTRDWTIKHHQLVLENYRRAPFLSLAVESFFDEIDKRYERLSDMNSALIRCIARLLEIDTRIVQSTDIESSGDRTQRLVSLVQAVGGTQYLSGPAAEAYLDVSAFKTAGISVEYKSYDYEPYPQLWGPFEGAVSILDLIMNTGPDARRFIKSLTPNRKVHL